MKLYAESARHRSRQIVSDAAVGGWILLWILIGTRLHAAVEALGEPGESLERAGEQFAVSVGAAGNEVGDLPLVGEALEGPFASVARAGEVVESAGVAQQEAVHALALWLGVLLPLIAIGYVLFRYAPERFRWTREATAAARFRGDADDLALFALRAVANRPLHELRRAVRDPADALARRDYNALAELELASLGLGTSPRRPSGRRGGG